MRENILTAWMSQNEKQDVTKSPLIQSACDFVETHNGKLQDGLAMANTLLPLNCDANTIAASILYPSIAARPTLCKPLLETLDKSLFKLISGVLKMETIHQVHRENDRITGQQNQIDNLRKMLLAMVDDIRVVLIKLADRLITLEYSKTADEKTQQDLAQEVMDYYVPLANRLGLGHLKWQLEDWCFRYLNPTAYQTISKALNKRRPEREQHIQEMIAKLKNLLQEIHLQGTSITGRAKHIYSIHRKMQRKQVPFEQLYDTNALRILVPTIENCYAVLSIVHAQWPHIPNEFDDYIANPKSNGYQSIHTAITRSDGTPVEIQIRTFAMHEQAELGIAAHWKYKENHTKQSSYEDKIAWLRDVLDWQKTFSDKEQDNIFQKAFSDRVYVFSPIGDAFDLPAGATALDFAYLIHTNIGHRCKGAKINGKLTPLTQPLKTGDHVEILTAKEGQPSRDWLRTELGFLTTMHAIRKVRHWFLHQELDKHIQAGAAIWEKAAKPKGFKKSDLLPIAKHFNFKNENGLLAALGTGDIHVSNILHQLAPSEKAEVSETKTAVKIATDIQSTPSSFDLTESGGTLLTQLAKCCNPIPGDIIMGYITQGKGITVHQAQCSNLKKALKDRPEKVIDIHWKDKQDHAYRLQLSITSEDHPGLINDITSVISHMNLSILTFQSYVNEKENIANIKLSIALKNDQSSKTIIQRLRQVSGVIHVERS